MRPRIFTQADIAAAMGRSRPTVNKYITALQDEGKFKKTVSNSYGYSESEMKVLCDLLGIDFEKLAKL